MPKLHSGTADILSTGYPNDTFGGLIFISFDPIDETDLHPHEVLADGSLRYTEGERASMLFHPYAGPEIQMLVQGHNIEKLLIKNNAESIVILRK